MPSYMIYTYFPIETNFSKTQLLLSLRHRLKLKIKNSAKWNCWNIPKHVNENFYSLALPQLDLSTILLPNIMVRDKNENIGQQVLQLKGTRISHSRGLKDHRKDWCEHLATEQQPWTIMRGRQRDHLVSLSSPQRKF